MKTTELETKRNKLAGELEAGKARFQAIALKGDIDKAREATLAAMTLERMLEAFDGEIKATRRRELEAELKRLNDEHAKAFLVAQNARRHSDAMAEAFNSRWVLGLAEIFPIESDGMHAKATETEAVNIAGREAKRAGDELAALKARIEAIRLELEAK